MAQPNGQFDHTPTNGAPESVAPEASTLLPTEAAYESVLPELLALSEDELATVNIDVMAAITTVAGVLPEIRALRAEIEAEWRSFDFEQFDKLEQYALALNHAHSLYRSNVSQQNVAGLAAELSEVRDSLIANAASLARLRLLNAERLKNLKTVPGYRALASDVLTLCAVFRDDWSKVDGKTPYTLAELHRVGTLALELVSAVGHREQVPVLAGEATLIRQKAFTLFLRAYDDARRAVHYLRAKSGDGDRIAPSLYAGRTSRRRHEEDVQEPSAPTLVSGTNGQIPTPAAAVESTPPAPFVIDNRAGLPIDHPFTS